jgi:5,10-methylenetetrahydromethanopterin reductase
MRLPAGEPLAAQAAFVRAVEESRELVAGVFVPDSQLLYRDPFVAVALAAREAPSSVFTLAATNVTTRHWTVVRNAARTVAESAPGRFRLTVALGDTAVGLAGLVRPSRAEFAAALHELASDDEGPRPPLLVATNAPRLLELAGTVADGIMVQAGCDAAVIGTLLAHARAGADAAGRDPDTLTVAASLWLADPSLDDDGYTDAVAARYVAASRRDRALIGLMGLPVLPEPAGPYVDLIHADGVEGIALDADVVAEYGRRTVVPRDPAAARRVLESLADVGVTEACLMPLSGDPLPDGVLTALRALATAGAEPAR